MPEQREPADDGGRIAARLRDLDGLSQIDDGGVRIALQEGDEPELAACAIRPPGITKLLGNREGLAP